ncbi:MAG: ribosome silencing factor [Lachnospiraceae bacterium]|nr:ribosome silencing factor [Lachnospiraceae bacterium]
MNKNESIRIKDMVNIAYGAVDEKKGHNIKVLDVSELTTIADYFILVTGTSTSQITALQDNVYKKLGDMGYKPSRIEGVRNSTWVLMDYNDIIVHIFSNDDREFYNLDNIWRDAKQVSDFKN